MLRYYTYRLARVRPFIHSFIHFFIANKCQNAFAVTYDYNILRLCY